MANQPRLPSPGRNYDTGWANQIVRTLEQQNLDIWNAIALIQMSTLPNYTTAEKGLLPNRAGYMIFDTDLGKACINTGAAWETITSVP